MPFASLLQTSISGGNSNALALQGDGVFLPKLSTASRTGLTLTASDSGLMVYDTTLGNQFIWTGSAWESIPASGDSSDTQVIFNDGGILSGDAGIIYDKTQSRFRVGTRIDIWRGLNASNSNTAVGFTALSLTQAAATGNTAVGSQAGLGVTTGASNTLIGQQAGFGVSTGNNNTGVGKSALSFNVSGSNNTACGAFAGSTTDSGSSNIMLGSFAATETAASSNQICIGSTSYWVGTNGSPSTWWAGASGAIGYWRVIINGIPVKIPVYAD